LSYGPVDRCGAHEAARPRLIGRRRAPSALSLYARCADDRPGSTCAASSAPDRCACSYSWYSSGCGTQRTPTRTLDRGCGPAAAPRSPFRWPPGVACGDRDARAPPRRAKTKTSRRPSCPARLRQTIGVGQRYHMHNAASRARALPSRPEAG